MKESIKKPVFVPRSEHKHSDVVVDIGRRRIRMTNHMVGEEYRVLEAQGYAKQVGEISVPPRAPSPQSEEPPKPDVTSGSEDVEEDSSPEEDPKAPEEKTKDEPEKEEESDADEESEEKEEKKSSRRPRRARRKAK